MTGAATTNTETTQLLEEVRTLCEQIIAAHADDQSTDQDSGDRVLITEFERAGLLDPQLLDSSDDVDTDTASDGGDEAGSAASARSSSPATAVIAAVAAANASVPAVEHLWNAAHLLRQAGLTPRGGPMTAASGDAVTVEPTGSGLILTGTVSNVAHLDVADTLVLLTQDGTVAQIPVADLEVADARSLAGISWSTVNLNRLEIPAGAHSPSSLNGEKFRDRNAVGRLIQIQAAAERATELTTAHLSSREQFGRPLKKFQAAQNRLSACIGETLMLGIGADLALAGRPDDIALARIDARRSVTVIRDNTHQLHGAMGITADYPLGRLCANMIAWLADTGSDRSWMTRARTHIETTGPWAAITGEEDET